MEGEATLESVVFRISFLNDLPQSNKRHLESVVMIQLRNCEEAAMESYGTSELNDGSDETNILLPLKCRRYISSPVTNDSFIFQPRGTKEK